MQKVKHGGTIPEWDVADRMTKALRTAGISVSDIALTLGVSRETIGRWTNGRGKPGRPALIAFAQITGVDLGWLEHGEQRQPGAIPAVPEKVPRRLLLVSGV